MPACRGSPCVYKASQAIARISPFLPSALSLPPLLPPSLVPHLLHSHPLQQTAYAWDTVEYVAQVLDRIVRRKALSMGLAVNDVMLDSTDTVTFWAEAMAEVAIDGVTGPMAFSRTGIRTTSTYHIKNLIPLNADADCSYNVSQGDEGTTMFPWFVETRATLTISNGPPVLQFLNCSGLPINASSLVFSGGDTAIPLDGPGRLYGRGLLSLTLL